MLTVPALHAMPKIAVLAVHAVLALLGYGKVVVLAVPALGGNSNAGAENVF